MSESLIERDRKAIWHPYTSLQPLTPPIPIVRGEGSFIFTDKNERLLDAISSWWVTIHGHAHPLIAQRIYEQAMRLEQVIFAGFTHEPAVQLAEGLLSVLPGTYDKVFFSDNGSTAVEVALKMSMQYWQNRGVRRHRIVAFEHAYHGDTFGAMSVSERGVFTRAFNDQLLEVETLPLPDHLNVEAILQTIDTWGDSVTAFIYEPLLQGAGGMNIYDASFLDRIIARFRLYDTVCIADEVLTGFGRTGKLFAGAYLQQQADLVCLSKGITGGTMALGATVCSSRITEAFDTSASTHTFFHGHSFTANPIACAAALASLELLKKDETKSAFERITETNKRFVDLLQQKLPEAIVSNPRSLGTVLAFEVKTGEKGYLNTIGRSITARALQSGIYLRPLGNTVYILPPYSTSRESMEDLYNFLGQLTDPGTIAKLLS
jgi:adenosylmethionine---8-amino-7-oxononanoate aminotransferase